MVLTRGELQRIHDELAALESLWRKNNGVKNAKTTYQISHKLLGLLLMDVKT